MINLKLNARVINPNIWSILVQPEKRKNNHLPHTPKNFKIFKKHINVKKE